MEQTTLKYLRILIPGIICLLGLYPIYQKYFTNIYEIKSLEYSYFIFLSMILGSLYYLTDIQHLVTHYSYLKINNNILNKLIEYSEKPLDDKQKDYLKKDKKYLNIFYKIIDKDETLKKKLANVYFNGIFWTSTADSFLLSLVFSIMYLVTCGINKSIIYSKMFLLIAILSLILHVISVVRHINLSNEQLRFIKQFHQTELAKDINDVLLKMP